MNHLTLSEPSSAKSMATGVTLRAIACQFGNTPAVRGIDLAVAPGEFLALVGPSGAGKTTLLRIIAGLQPGATGEVRLGARDVTMVPARARNIGFVFQNYALFRHMSVSENVAFGLKVKPRTQRPDRAAIATRVAELLELVQVGPLALRYPGQLSGGQRQRVALARALATEPSVLLLDEPFGALDPVVRKEIRGWLRELHDRIGLTSILVTHDQEEALDVADRIAVLRDGRLEQVGTPQDLEDQPANLFVHRFLGETIDFPVIARQGRLRVRGAWAEIGVELPATDCLDGEAMLSMRPYQAILLPPDPGRMSAIVSSVRRSGAFRHCRILPGPGADDTMGVTVMVPSSLPAIEAGMRCQLDLSGGRVFQN